MAISNLISIALTTVIALGPQTGEPTQGRQDSPVYAIRFGSGAVEELRGSVEDPRFASQLAEVGDGVWELRIKAGNQPIAEVWFPWEGSANPLNAETADDVLYYPHWMGQARRVDSLEESRWEGRTYPGECFAPLMVIADGKESRMAAAVNWPPRRVFVGYARHRIGLRYDNLEANREHVFRAMIRRDVCAADRAPWHAPIDAYRTWLHEHMTREGLYPIPYPQWMRDIQGWQNVQLENYRTEDLWKVYENWKRYRAVFPWIQMWGQMSDFFQPQDKETGCCLQKPSFHSRYDSLFEKLLPEARSEGHCGFYSRPGRGYEPLAGDRPRGREFLLNWIKVNGERGANAHYLDVCGAHDFGPPLEVAKMFGREFPRESVIELPMDVYPAAYLISGCLWGGAYCRTRPGQRPGDLSSDLTCVSFPEMGRYLFHDRIFFMGESNGDHTSWGTDRGLDHWTERQVFLLGAKFDAMRIGESESSPGRLNRALELILGERIRVDWWKRSPIYMDTEGLCDIPPDADVRRYRGSGGEELLVIDNWNRVSGRFRFKGRDIPLPAEQVRILVDP